MPSRRSRVHSELSPADLDSALQHIVIDRWSVDQITGWSRERGYTISRSAWGRFSKDLLDRWDDDQRMRMHAQAVASEFDAESGMGLGDAAGMLIQKRALSVLADLQDQAEPGALLALAKVVGELSRARVNTERFRQTRARARAEALEEMTEEFRLELQEQEPQLWERLRAWLERKRAAEAEAA